MKEQDAHQAIPTDVEVFYRELREEFDHILDFWKRFSRDEEKGGFVGKMDQQGRYIPDAPKGSVLHSRILWTFSAAYKITGDPDHLAIATRAFDYICIHFNDLLDGGLYWTVDADGKPLDTHKQIYAQSFGIYGMSEYYRATVSEQALALAIEWYRLIERYGLDMFNKGYIDAFARDWSFLEDKRLSAKDDNAVKTMNTHLHILEAYANLYEIWPDPILLLRIKELLALFQEKILDKNSFHLHLFFDEQWTRKPGPISYGHDIEAGWLLHSCATTAGDEFWMDLTKSNAIRITEAAMEGLDEDGGLWYEWDAEANHLLKEKHWWPQAEALIGLCNAWQLSGNMKYRNAMLFNWQFIKRYIIDQENGEWFWGVNARHELMENQDKIGLWKCPYHNVRACVQLLKRLNPTF
ncbi:MAG: AGE family epimerase/isomerase [Bacteroidota bacterium]|nr:AGE family epimerase/isomerase [Bacteroidota bacterium]MDP4212113.1 AGE family epimerase/isomerase [Bacteroidota bacterium]